MLKQNRGRIIAQVGLVVVLLFIAMGLFLFRNKINQCQAVSSVVSRPVALYTGGIASNAMGEATYYSNEAR